MHVKVDWKYVDTARFKVVKETVAATTFNFQDESTVVSIAAAVSL